MSSKTSILEFILGEEAYEGFQMILPFWQILCLAICAVLLTWFAMPIAMWIVGNSGFYSQQQLDDRVDAIRSIAKMLALASAALFVVQKIGPKSA